MFNLYQYNTRSELTSAERYFGNNTNDISNPVGLQDWSYAHDNIGNRTWTTKANAAASYTANALNQYTERSVPGSSDIIGSAAQDVTITVNEEEADRQGYYWSHRLTVDNLFNPIYTQIVVEAICDPGTNDPFVVSSETGSVFVAESPESFTYDDDGNLLSDGRFEYQWDCENRLVAATTKEGLPADLPIVHVEFAYDYMSRRIGKTVYRWDTGVTNWVQTDARSFLYDGWLLVQEQSASGGNVITNWYVHGLDLSGSLQGAGGIGGLLAAQLGTNSVVYCYDANGNVSELLSMNGTILAHYEYNPFGETIVATGPMATENKFRFSTKYFCDEFGMGDWGYRWYSPPMGRFLSRDPIGVPGFETCRRASSSSGVRMTIRRNSRGLLFNGHNPSVGFSSVALAVENGHLYRAFLNNSLSWVDPHGLTSFMISYIPPFDPACPAYCCDCDFAAVDALIANQKSVIEQLKKLIEEEGDLSPFDPRIKQFANAGGGRSEEYKKSSSCIQHATDRLENNVFRSIADVFRVMDSFAEMEIGRSTTFIKFLDDVKRVCKNCRRTQA